MFSPIHGVHKEVMDLEVGVPSFGLTPMGPSPALGRKSLPSRDLVGISNRLSVPALHLPGTPIVDY